MRAQEFLIEYVGMDEPYPDLHQDPDSVPNNVNFKASIPDTNRILTITFWNLVSDTSVLLNFRVIDISFGITKPDKSTTYEPPAGIRGTPQARSNARQMFRILSTVIDAIDRYIAEYGTPEAFAFAPSTDKLNQLYSRLEPRITKKYGYTPVSLVRLGDIASSGSAYDHHDIFQFFDTRGQYFVRNDLIRHYD